ncbi:hypothetical protein [Variovorax arabinosiphilus]|uniref:hypothetical protein n=1 Tax=Variovorax arabinosiphilus TaxID=3053498 RepID=UPI002576C5DA|nr:MULTISPECIES: hypothetical protein [unclassified Variovorax]MDM0118862.1 hypothetical protein [Variovorax sp. J2L1-78]MDM0129287.1 hypothetical protein [Variovorax sp. J2L1-63]MDM0232926.1 hypothetical protein [Variovorax sp. J2R1-6]
MLTAPPLAFFGVSACIFFVALLIIGFLGTKLANRDPSDVRLIWYLFSLTTTLTIVVAWWASGAGAINAAGSFRGTAGNWLMRLLMTTLDIETTLKVYAAVVGLIVAPQLLSWVLSGLFGCASAPRFIGPALRFLFWSTVKSFVVLAGVVLAATAYGWFRSWDGMTARLVVVHVWTALMALTAAFGTLYMYRDLSEPWQPESEPGPNAAKLRRIIYRINAWMNRRIPQAQTAELIDS